MRNDSFGKRFEKSTVAKIFAMSYIVFLGVSVTVNVCIYENINRNMISHITEYNESILKSWVESIEGQMSDISTNATRLSLLEDIDDAVQYDTAGIDANRLEILKNIKNISYQMNEYVESNIIYCHKSETILRNNAVDDAKRYYNAYFSKYFNDYNEWKEFIKSAPSGSLLRIDDKFGKSYSVLYIYQFNAIGSPEAKGTVVTQLGDVSIFNKEDAIEYLKTDSGEIITANTVLTNDELSDDNKKYMRFEFKSKYLDINYVYLMPKKKFLSPLKSIKVITVFGNLIYLAIACVLIWYFTRTNYKPIKDITNIITKRVGMNKYKDKNEYRLISQAINTLIEKYEDSMKMVNMSKEFLKNSILSDFIKGEYCSDIPIDEQFKRLGINFDGADFYIAIFYFDDLSKMFFEEKDANNVEDYELAKFVLKNVFEDVVSSDMQGIFFDINKMLTCAINLPHNNDELEKVINEINDILVKKLNIHFKTAISNVCHSIEELPMAYREAINASYRRYTEDEIILKPQKGKNDKGVYVYRFEKEQQIISYMQSGNGEGAKKLINDILIDSIKKNALSKNAMRCVVFDIYATLWKLYDMSGASVGEMSLEELPLNDVSEDMGDIIEGINIFIDKYVKDIEVKELSKKNIAQRAEEIILNEYTDSNLSVSYIARKLDVSANYLSAKYKSIRGVPLLEYINIMRVEKAKKILLSTDKKLEEVAKDVGFTNVRTFIRVFRKYVGTSPSSYSETI